MANHEIPVKINVKTTINDDETFELLVFGRYHQKNQATFLQYEEAHEDGTVRTIVKVTKDEGLILRGGAVKMRLPFRLHKKTRGSYEMPFGTFEIITDTHRITQSEGLIDILYDFTMEGSSTSTYHLEISFQEDHK